MSVSSQIGNLFSTSAQDFQDNAATFQTEFQQLGTDLQAGNLSAAQQDFVTLQSSAPGANSSSTSTSSTTTNPLAQAFNQLSTDLQSGNLSAAQQDFATIQQALQSRAAHGHHHHGHRSGSQSGDSNSIGEQFQQLGAALQSGNLSSAQQAYATLQQDFQSFSSGDSTTTSASTAISAVA